ncbi:MAG: polyphosphate polymerase domain-containing protein [Clostridiales bacterium]|nr:polyphosphate polymerase domain-containing protein [Clostridiales bacterium]
MADQMVFKRHEIKYMLTSEQKQILLDGMREHMTEDEHGRSTILSLYLDTPDFLLIRRSMDGPLYREKLRLRSYGVADGDTTVFLELKKKYDSVVYKRRIALTEAQAEDYLAGHGLPEDTQISREIDYSVKHYNDIAPRVLLSYERDAFYANDDHEFRVTFDQNILWRNYNLDLTNEIGGEPILKDGQVLMEIKVGEAMPLWMVKLLSANHLYQTSFSKYANAYSRICGGHQAQPKISWAKTGRKPAGRGNGKITYENGGNYNYA